MNGASTIDGLSDDLSSYLRALDTVPGWLEERDLRLLAEVDRLHQVHGIDGDLLEIGVYHGKTAIVLGLLLHARQRLALCDVFGDQSKLSPENRIEGETWYDRYGMADFERSYLRFHPELPTVWAMPSTEIDADGLAGTFRLLHIDGSHNYEVVRQDIRTAEQLLGEGGVVVFDDWCTAHNPGVALAIWEEVLRGKMQPLCLTRNKMYASWDPDRMGGPAALEAWALANDLDVEIHRLAGWPVRRFSKRAIDMPAQVANADLETARLMLKRWQARVTELER